MLKNVFLIAAALVFAFGILTASVYRTSAQTVAPNFKVESLEMEMTEGEEEATPEAKEPVDYVLPWPGILPDHFLYPLKMVRDRIWLFLTTDPLNKAELLLKFADKRIYSAQLLFDKGKAEQGLSTATKAEKYLERAINQEKVAREKGKDTAAFLEKLAKATLKHEEILLEMKEKIGETGKSVIDTTLEYSRQGYQQVMEVLGR